MSTIPSSLPLHAEQHQEAYFDHHRRRMSLSMPPPETTTMRDNNSSNTAMASSADIRPPTGGAGALSITNLLNDETRASSARHLPPLLGRTLSLDGRQAQHQGDGFAGNGYEQSSSSSQWQQGSRLSPRPQDVNQEVEPVEEHRRPSLGRPSYTYHGGGDHHPHNATPPDSLSTSTSSSSSAAPSFHRQMPWVRTDAHEDRELGWDIPESVRRSSAPILRAGEEANREEMRRKMRFFSHHEPLRSTRMPTHNEHREQQRLPPPMDRHLSSGSAREESRQYPHHPHHHRHHDPQHEHRHYGQHHHHHHQVDPLPTPGSAAIDGRQHHHNHDHDIKHEHEHEHKHAHRPATTPSFSTYSSRIVQLDSPPPSAALPDAATPASIGPRPSTAAPATANPPSSTTPPASVPPSGSSRAPISRTTKACNACRQRKVRCDAGATTGEMKPNGEPGTCSRCKETGIECVYTTEQRKRGPMPGSVRGSVSAAAAAAAGGNPGLRRKSSNQHLVGGTPSQQQLGARGSVAMARYHSEGSEYSSENYENNHHSSNSGGGGVYRRTTGAPYGYRRAMPPHSLSLTTSDHPALRRPSGVDPLSSSSSRPVSGAMARQVSIATAFSSVSLDQARGEHMSQEHHHHHHDQHQQHKYSLAESAAHHQDRINMFRQSYSLQGAAGARRPSPDHPSPQQMRTGGAPREFARSESPLHDLQLPPIRVLID